MNNFKCITKHYFTCDLKLSLGSACKIVSFGLSTGVNLILLDNVLRSMLIPSSGLFMAYVGKQEAKVYKSGGQRKGANESMNIRTNGRVV
jgi:hypothetical protein